MTTISPLADSSVAQESLVQRTMRALEKHIWGSGFKVGQSLPSEGSLAELLGVSRTVMREAVGALSVLGVLDVANGRRPRVAKITSFPLSISLGHALHTGQVTFQQIWDVRRRLEVGAAAAAATHRTYEEAVELMEIAKKMRECDPFSTEMTQLDLSFHRLIAKLSRNTILESITLAFHPLLEVAVPLAWETRITPAEQTLGLDQHLDIARTIFDRDVEGAEAAMNAHFDRAISAVVGEVPLAIPAVLPAQNSISENAP